MSSEFPVLVEYGVAIAILMGEIDGKHIVKEYVLLNYSEILN